MHDLMPFICLFSNCSDPYRMYATSQDWLRHIGSEHGHTSWTCSLCRTATPVQRPNQFYDADSYKRHMSSVHPDPDMGPGAVSFLARITARTIPPPFENCVFCRYRPEMHADHFEYQSCQDSLVTHMHEQHMLPLAIASLPWHASGIEHASSGPGARDTEGSTRDQSSEQCEAKDLCPLEFSPSDAETKQLELRPEMAKCLLGDRNASSANLNEIKRHSGFALSRDKQITVWLANLLETPALEGVVAENFPLVSHHGTYDAG